MIFGERRISHNIFALSLDWDIRSLAPDYTRLRKLFIIAIIPNLWNCLQRESKKSFLWPPRPKSPIKETIIVLSKRTFLGTSTPSSFCPFWLLANSFSRDQRCPLPRLIDSTIWNVLLIYFVGECHSFFLLCSSADSLSIKCVERWLGLRLWWC